ncbi:MAG: polysaccharide deacetylase family protein [Candidatus Sericytochromatia bacterium]|nr:polysaccharide deacetylase family protein [Candidatus Sericytochromatia bacterium]
MKRLFCLFLILTFGLLACAPTPPATQSPGVPEASVAPAAGASGIAPAQPRASAVPAPAPTLPPLSAENLLSNGDAESAEGWTADHWGDLQAQLRRETADDAYDGRHYLAAEVQNFAEGDAKWVHDPVTLAPGWYEYSAAYRSDGRSRLIWSCTRPDGSRSFYTGGQTHSSADWQPLRLRFYVSPEQADCAISVMHVLDRNGWQHSDHHSLLPAAAHPLTRPLVSISFDDIWTSAATAGADLLEARGWKGSFYIAGNYVRSGEAAHANPDQVRALLQQGHEIGSHSQTHAMLSTLDYSELTQDLRDHHQYLEWLGADPRGMAYPFGDFDQQVETETQRFHAYARTSLTGLNDRLTDPYRLKIFPVTAATTTAELKRWVDDAQRTRTWLVFLFHDLNDTPGEYFYTTGLSQYRELLEYIAAQNLTVLPVDEALAEVQAQRLK